MGILIGAYGATISRAYNHSCFSELYAFATTNMINNQVFDQGIPNQDHWYGPYFFAAQMAGIAVSFVNVTGSCLNDLQ